MDRTRVSRLAIIALLVAAAQAAADLQEDIEAGLRQFRVGYHAWDREALASAEDTFEAACARHPREYAVHYWLGTVRFHMLLHRSGDLDQPMEDPEFRHLTRDASKPLETATRLNAADSEAHAMLGTITGMRIGRNRKRALWLGPALMRHRSHALRHGARNPRTQYLVGAGYLHGPGYLGGPAKGLPFLLKAEELYEEESKAERESTAPAWGRDHCLVFIGEVFRGMGEPDRSEVYFRKALEVNPQSGLARRALASLRKDGGSNE